MEGPDNIPDGLREFADLIKEPADYPNANYRLLNWRNFYNLGLGTSLKFYNIPFSSEFSPWE